jgi:putative ABC transport system ATP-binding protein
VEIPHQVTDSKQKNGRLSMATIVEAENLKKTYMLGKVPVEALRGVNLKVESGDFLAILGPSGSGKSTLLNLIGALDKPTEGKMLIENIDISTLNDNQLADLRLRIGFVFQFFNLIPRFTAIENVELSMSIAGMSRAERRKRAENLLETVGLKERMNHKPAELSGGEQQRVAIARALVNNPRFLLMDEPTGNIDSKTANEIMGLIKRLNEEKGVTIIMVTHDQHLAAQTKRTVQMFDGIITGEVVN